METGRTQAQIADAVGFSEGYSWPITPITWDITPQVIMAFLANLYSGTAAPFIPMGREGGFHP